MCCITTNNEGATASQKWVLDARINTTELDVDFEGDVAKVLLLAFFRECFLSEHALRGNAELGVADGFDGGVRLDGVRGEQEHDQVRTHAADALDLVQHFHDRAGHVALRVCDCCRGVLALHLHAVGQEGEIDRFSEVAEVFLVHGPPEVDQAPAFNM